jgi:hypothetical protein
MRIPKDSEYMSTTEAATLMGSSRNYILNIAKTNLIQSKLSLWGKKPVVLIHRESMQAHALKNADNAKIGRTMLIPKERKLIKVNGYYHRYKPKHLRACFNGYVPEHVLVMEEHIERPLTKEEVVHHKDRDRLNNNINNLQLCSSQEEHMRLHSKIKGLFLRVQARPDIEDKAVELLESLLQP